jgi:methyl-accepting chemotaxis protein
MMDLQEAIRAHSEWKTKLRGAITAQSTLDVATIARDDCCQLGKWLHGDSKPVYGPLSSHVACLHKHADFHKEAAKVAGAINAKKFTDAEQMLESGSAYALASNEVIYAIGALKREAKL